MVLLLEPLVLSLYSLSQSLSLSLSQSLDLFPGITTLPFIFSTPLSVAYIQVRTLPLLLLLRLSIYHFPPLFLPPRYL